MAQLSKQLTALLKRVDNACEVFSVYGEEITGKLEEELAAAEEGYKALWQEYTQKNNGKMPGFVFQTVSGLVALARLRQKIAEEADYKVFIEQGEDTATYNQCTTVVEETRQGTIQVKKLVDALYGGETNEALGMAGETPDSPHELCRMLEGALKALQNPDILPPPLDPDLPAWSNEQLSARLEKLLTPVVNAEKELRRERKETQEAQIERRQRIQHLRRLIVAIDAVLETFARLVGLDDIADRIRLPGGRAASKNSSTADPTPADPTPADPTPADPS